MPLFGQLQESRYLCHLLASKVFASLVVLGLEVFVYQHPVDTNLFQISATHLCSLSISGYKDGKGQEPDVSRKVVICATFWHSRVFASLVVICLEVFV